MQNSPNDAVSQHVYCCDIAVHQAWGQASFQATSLTIPCFGWGEVR